MDRVKLKNPFARKRLILITGLSGAGKTTLVRGLSDPPFRAVQLDRVLKGLSTVFDFDSPSPYKNRGKFWTEKLMCTELRPRIIDAFREQITRKLSPQHRFIVLEGTSLAHVEIERAILEALTNQGDISLAEKLYLRVSPQIALQQRTSRALKRNGETYRDLTQVENWSKELDRKLRAMGYQFSNARAIQEILRHQERDFWWRAKARILEAFTIPSRQPRPIQTETRGET